MAVLGTLIWQYTNNLKKIYGNSLRKIILYGSYARGDFSDKSDVDILILLKMSDADTRLYTNNLIDMTYDFNEKYDIYVQPYAKSDKEFQKWSNIDPFLVNVNKEGIILYDAA